MSHNVPAVGEVSRLVSYLLPVTLCCSNCIPDKELVNPQLPSVAPYYPLLLSKTDVIFDNILPVFAIIAHNAQAKK
jgi:hypothetical protein